MRKKVDQFFIENFRSWSGRNYFDLNNINFLFGSNSSGKSSVIHALSLLRQSITSIDGFANAIDFLSPIGEFTDLGPIKKQAFSTINNKKLEVSDYISFGYKFKDIDKFIKVISHANRSMTRRGHQQKTVSDFKNLELFKGIKEVVLSYNFLSLSGKIDSISLMIDDFKLIEIRDINNKIQVELPKDETFWRNNLNISKFEKNGKTIEVLESNRTSSLSERRRKERWSKANEEVKQSLIDLEHKKAMTVKKVQSLEIIQENIKILIQTQEAIRNKSNNIFEKDFFTIFKKIDFSNILTSAIDKLTIQKLYDQNYDEILQNYSDISHWHNIEQERNQTRDLVQEILSLIKILGYKATLLSDMFLELNSTDKLNDNLHKILERYGEINIRLLLCSIYKDSWKDDSIEQLMPSFFEISYLFRYINEFWSWDRKLSEISEISFLNLNKEHQVDLNLNDQIKFYLERKETLEKEQDDLEDENDDSIIPFKDFISLINDKSYITINYDEDFPSLSEAIHDLAYQNYYTLNLNDKKQNQNLIKLINNNAILTNSSIFSILRNSQKIFFSNFRDLKVIGPHRRRPNRIELINPFEITKNVGIEGQNILNVLKNATPDDINELNIRLKTLQILYSVSTEFREEDNSIKVLVKDNNGLSVSLTDVGYGVGQILPIVVECVISKNKIITIEQPELHLHPTLQSNLTDLIIWSSKINNNKFILETHSEHMILRLKRRLRENFEKEDKGDPNVETLTNDITINVITTNKNHPSSQNKLLKITSSGNFNGKWPEGFFEERFEELGIE